MQFMEWKNNMKPMITIINVENNSIENREMFENELLEFEQAQKDHQNYKAKLQAKAEAQAAAKTALLDRLGITEDEAKLLLA